MDLRWILAAIRRSPVYNYLSSAYFVIYCIIGKSHWAHHVTRSEIATWCFWMASVVEEIAFKTNVCKYIRFNIKNTWADKSRA